MTFNHKVAGEPRIRLVSTILLLFLGCHFWVVSIDCQSRSLLTWIGYAGKPSRPFGLMAFNEMSFSMIR